MQITLLGLILLPLSLLWANLPVRLLQLALIASVFEAAAAMVFGGSFGLQPAMVPGLLFIGYIVFQYAIGMRYPGEGSVLRAVFPLMALLFYGLLSAWLLPNEFAGRIMVWPQRPDVLASGMVPLEFSSGNITQPLYLALDIVCAVSVAIFMTRSRLTYENIIAAYLLGGYIVVGLVFWQFASRIAGIPFPDELLHSNPSWSIVEQSVGTVPRIQGPFSEPAALGGYMSGIALCTLWLTLRGYRLMRPNLLFSLALFSVFLSTSTTGLVTLIVGIPITIALASAGGDARALGRIGKTMGLLVLVGAVAIGPVLILRPSLLDAIGTVATSTLEKRDSSSFEDRTAADTGALAAARESYGLGVGWGSYRSSSLVPGLLANAGVFGVVMVLWQAIRLFRLGRRARRLSPRHPGQILVDGFSAALCTQLGSALISAPMIASLAFYLQLGCIIGVLSRMTIEHRIRADRRARSPSLMPGWTPATPTKALAGSK